MWRSRKIALLVIVGVAVILVSGSLIRTSAQAATCDNNVPVGGFACRKEGEPVIFKCKVGNPNQQWEEINCANLGGGTCSNAGTPHCSGGSSSPVDQWQCNTSSANAATQKLFNDTWCNGKAQWLFQAGCGGPGGAPLKVNGICPVSTVSPNQSRKDCSYAKDRGYACLSLTECVRCDNGTTVRNQDNNSCTGLPCGPTPTPTTNSIPATSLAPADPAGNPAPTQVPPPLQSSPTGENGGVCRIGQSRCIDGNTSEIWQGPYGWQRDRCVNGCNPETGECKVSGDICEYGEIRCSDDGNKSKLCTTSGWQIETCKDGCNAFGRCCNKQYEDCSLAARQPNSKICGGGPTVRCTADKTASEICADGKWVKFDCSYGCSGDGQCCNPACETCPSGATANTPQTPAGERRYPLIPGYLCPAEVGYRCDPSTQKCVGDLVGQQSNFHTEQDLNKSNDNFFQCCTQGCQEKNLQETAGSYSPAAKIMSCAEWAKIPNPGYPADWWVSPNQTICDKNGRNSFDGCVQILAAERAKYRLQGFCPMEDGRLGTSCCTQPDIPYIAPTPVPIDPSTVKSCSELAGEEFPVCTTYISTVDPTDCKSLQTGQGCVTQEGTRGNKCCSERINRITSCAAENPVCTNEEPGPGMVCDTWAGSTDSYLHITRCIRPDGSAGKYCCPRPTSSQEQNRIDSAPVTISSNCTDQNTLAIKTADSEKIVPREPGQYCYSDPQTRQAYYKSNENLCGQHKLGDHWSENNTCYTCAELVGYSSIGQNVKVNEPKYQIALPGNINSPAYCKSDPRYVAVKAIMQQLGYFRECIDGICPAKL